MKKYGKVLFFALMISSVVIATDKKAVYISCKKEAEISINAFHRGFDAGSDEMDKFATRLTILEKGIDHLKQENNDQKKINTIFLDMLNNQAEQIENQKEKIEDLYTIVDILNMNKQNKKKRKSLSEKNNRLRNILKNKK